MDNSTHTKNLELGLTVIKNKLRFGEIVPANSMMIDGYSKDDLIESAYEKLISVIPPEKEIEKNISYYNQNIMFDTQMSEPFYINNSRYLLDKSVYSIINLFRVETLDDSGNTTLTNVPWRIEHLNNGLSIKYLHVDISNDTSSTKYQLIYVYKKTEYELDSFGVHNGDISLDSLNGIIMGSSNPNNTIILQNDLTDCNFDPMMVLNLKTHNLINENVFGEIPRFFNNPETRTSKILVCGLNNISIPLDGNFIYPNNNNKISNVLFYKTVNSLIKSENYIKTVDQQKRFLNFMSVGHKPIINVNNTTDFAKHTHNINHPNIGKFDIGSQLRTSYYKKPKTTQIINQQTIGQISTNMWESIKQNPIHIYVGNSIGLNITNTLLNNSQIGKRPITKKPITVKSHAVVDVGLPINKDLTSIKFKLNLIYMNNMTLNYSIKTFKPKTINSVCLIQNNRTIIEIQKPRIKKPYCGIVSFIGSSIIRSQSMKNVIWKTFNDRSCLLVSTNIIGVDIPKRYFFKQLNNISVLHNNNIIIKNTTISILSGSIEGLRETNIISLRGLNQNTQFEDTKPRITHKHQYGLNVGNIRTANFLRVPTIKYNARRISTKIGYRQIIMTSEYKSTTNMNGIYVSESDMNNDIIITTYGTRIFSSRLVSEEYLLVDANDQHIIDIPPLDGIDIQYNGISLPESSYNINDNVLTFNFNTVANALVKIVGGKVFTSTHYTSAEIDRKFEDLGYLIGI